MSVGDVLVVTRFGGLSSWKFIKNDRGHYESKQRQHTYRLMFDGLASEKPIWIGKVLPLAIVTAEAEIRARAVQFMFGTYLFIPRA